MQQENSRRSNKDRTEATRAALIAGARALFVKKGYGETSTPDIVKTAGVTRGALYHHFKDKEDVFRAVVHAETKALARAIEKDAKESATPRDALIDGAESFFTAMKAPGRARLLLMDGPAILGRTEMDRYDALAGGNELRIGLKTAMDAGMMRQAPIKPLAALLSSAFDRAALAINDGDDPEDHRTAIAALIDGLLVD